jgi:hypothetical protein
MSRPTWRLLFGDEGSWRAANADKFPSEGSFRWHFRKFEDYYVETGAAVKLRGRWWATERMDTAVVEVAVAEAKRSRVARP